MLLSIYDFHENCRREDHTFPKDYMKLGAVPMKSYDILKVKIGKGWTERYMSWTYNLQSCNWKCNRILYNY